MKVVSWPNHSHFSIASLRARSPHQHRRERDCHTIAEKSCITNGIDANERTMVVNIEDIVSERSNGVK